MTKQEIRQQIKNEHKLYSDSQLEQMSKSVIKKVLCSKFYQGAKVVLLFNSLPDEIDVKPLIDNALTSKKTLLLPIVVGEDIVLKHHNINDGFIKGKFGILEPTGEIFNDYDKIDFALIPGVAFDKNFNRLGRGKGYYDRLLPKLINAKKMGICFEYQVFEKIPTENHDIKMDGLFY